MPAVAMNAHQILTFLVIFYGYEISTLILEGGEERETDGV